MTGPATIRFTVEDLRLFSAASHDRNPLHLDAAYARTTQFGRPVVFGVLGGLACAAALEVPAGEAVTKVAFEFGGPMFTDVEYTVRAAARRGDVTAITLGEGARPLVKATFTLGASLPPATGAPIDAAVPAAEAADLRRADIVAGESHRGTWRAGAVGDLRRRLGIAPAALTTGQLAALLWSSYLVGMEVPGRRALYSMLTLGFRDAGPADGALAYDVTVRASDERFGLVRLAVALGDTASGEVRAFVRERAEEVGDDESPSDVLAGRSALVIGASRGLGAQIARALVQRGATVYAGHRPGSDDDIAVLHASLGDRSAQLVATPGDGADPAWCATTVERICHEQGGLDIVVCNAAPTILPMWFDAVTAERTVDYVADSVRLVASPLAASLAALEERRGWLVAISSIYAETAPATYPHYVAAKGAIEGLVRAVAHHRTHVGFLLVRPPRLLGELNLPVAGETPIAASTIAAAIADRLAGEPPAGTVEVLAAAGSVPPVPPGP